MHCFNIHNNHLILPQVYIYFAWYLGAFTKYAQNERKAKSLKWNQTRWVSKASLAVLTNSPPWHNAVLLVIVISQSRLYLMLLPHSYHKRTSTHGNVLTQKTAMQCSVLKSLLKTRKINITSSLLLLVTLILKYK